MLNGMERLQRAAETAGLNKKCGNCTACCGPSSLHVPGVFGAWERCPHARAKTCGIYTDRPRECRDYQCMWTQASAWPSELRPDRCGFIGIYNEGESEDHLHVVFCEAPPGVKPHLLGRAIMLLLTSCRDRGSTRITLLYGDQSLEPKVEIDVPFTELADRPGEEVALEVLGLWGFNLQSLAGDG